MTTTKGWVVLVSGRDEDGNGFCFIATDGFESEQDALDFTADNHTAYADEWNVEVVTEEQAEDLVF